MIPLVVRRAFTLVELLVVIAVIAVMVGVLLPALAGARSAGRDVVCLSNLRSIMAASSSYADEYRGWGPAIGQPYASYPNWAFVVTRTSGQDGATTKEAMRERGVLVCPTAVGSMGQDRGEPIIRTYGVNATGQNQSLFAEDTNSYDDPLEPAHVRTDRIAQPSWTVWCMDTLPGPSAPAGRTASVVDLRLSDHVQNRIARPHARRRTVQASFFDGSSRSVVEIPEWWFAPLP
jgi:prepilin-type N-terminal cleavage/methylation domain-containing protein